MTKIEHNYKKLLFDRSFVNGEWTSLLQDKIDIKNPVDNSTVHTVLGDGRALTDDAVVAASEALQSWKSLSAKERSVLLMKWYSLLIEFKDELATIMTLESGKPIGESKGEVDYGASYVQFFAEEAKRNYGEIIPGYTSDRRIAVIKQPVGVVAAITPWNFPLAMITRKVAPALAVGCTVVIRPSEETPLTALAITHLAHVAGIPIGVMNTVIGRDASEMGKELCEHKKVSKISFTGSTRVGKILMQQCAPTLKKMSLELGGNAPFIVFKDADIDLAVTGAIAGKFRFAGQTCVCVNRILVQDDIYEAFCAKFVHSVNKLKMGDALDPTVDIGPVISKKAIERLESMIKDALQKGGSVLHGGKKAKDLFFEPTIIGDVSPEMLFSTEEIFGPIAPIFRFKTDEEAIELANNTEYGLASYLYTNDISRAIKISEKLEYGMVGVNEGLISSEMVPFGGVKHSGQGREGSRHALDDYTEIKYICYGNIK